MAKPLKDHVENDVVIIQGEDLPRRARVSEPPRSGGPGESPIIMIEGVPYRVSDGACMSPGKEHLAVRPLYEADRRHPYLFVGK